MRWVFPKGCWAPSISTFRCYYCYLPLLQLPASERPVLTKGLGQSLHLVCQSSSKTQQLSSQLLLDYQYPVPISISRTAGWIWSTFPHGKHFSVITSSLNRPETHTLGRKKQRTGFPLAPSWTRVILFTLRVAVSGRSCLGCLALMTLSRLVCMWTAL